MRTASLSIFSVLLIGVLAGGCSGSSQETTTSSGTTLLPDATTVTSGTTVDTTIASTTTSEAVAAGAAADAGCVGCHTDQATLQALAVEPVAGEILSEGEG